MVSTCKTTRCSGVVGFAAPLPVRGGVAESCFAASTSVARKVGTVCATAGANESCVEDVGPSVSRRAFIATLASLPIIGAVAERDAVRAENLSGQLTVYRDLPKGFTIFRPNGWNEFEALQDNYDMKWQDVIQPLEFVTVLTTPLPKERSLADLGDVQAVGSKLAESRSGELVSASEKDIDGTPAYILEIKREQAHQLTLLAVSKMKLYSVNASCSERRWPRRERLLRAVIDSFKPKL